MSSYGVGFCSLHSLCRFTPQNWQPETTFQRVVTIVCSPPHRVRFTDLWTRSGTDHYNYGLNALYLLPLRVKGLGKNVVVKAFATACGQRYKNVVTAKEMFHCKLLVWSQLAVSEGFGGITYCLADSNFGVSRESVGQVKTACIQRSTYVFCLRALRFMLITFLYHVILIILKFDWRCQHSGRAHEK